MNRLKDLGLQAVNSLWFFPSVMTALLAALAFGIVSFDVWLDGSERYSVSERLPWVFSSSPEGARAMLGTIAGALITAAGVTFSGVLVALSIASSQYTSRILASFTADRFNQFTVGLIVGAFVYCLMVLRTIGVEGDTFVPEVAVAGGILLGAGSVCNLILFVHSVARAIQAGEILAHITDDTIQSLKSALPEPPAEGDPPADARDDPPRDSFGDAVWQAVESRTGGYLRTVDLNVLIKVATRFDLVVWMEHAVGSFVHERTPLLSYLSLGTHDDSDVKELESTLRSAHTIGSFRTVEQDPAFGLRQLVDIALRALSPGINDTTTAVMVVHRVTQILLFAGRRTMPSAYRYNDGQLRLCVLQNDLLSLTKLGYDQVYASSRGNEAAIFALLVGWVEVARLLEDGPVVDHLIELVDRVTRDDENQRALRAGEWPAIEAECARIRALAGRPA